MAEPVLRDPDPQEPARPRGPQPVRAVTPTESTGTVPGEPIGNLSPEPGAVTVDPSRELPAVATAASSEPGEFRTEPPRSGTRRAGRESSRSRTSIPGSLEAEREAIIASEVASEAAAVPPRPSSSRSRTSSARVSAPPIPETSNSRVTHERSPSQEMLHELRTRLEELKERVERQTVATRVSLKRELTQDADYLKIRARYYHERRPLEAVGMVAAGSFVLGLFIGLWRR